MTDWILAQQRSDATRIRNQLRRMFGGDSKGLIRTEVVEFLWAHGVRVPLEAWGGGLGAEAMLKRGMSPIVVDDGRVAEDLSKQWNQKVRPGRVIQAMTFSGLAAGYETRRGKLERHAADADGAWVDPCGQWAKELSRTVHACRHMKAVAITIMPERTPLGQLSPHEWDVALLAIVKDALGWNNVLMRIYARRNGQRVVVFLASPVRRPPTQDLHNAQQRAYHAHRLLDPAYRERHNARKRALWAADPAYRERRNAQKRASRATPAGRKQAAARERAYMADPAHRERRNAQQRAGRARRKAKP